MRFLVVGAGALGGYFGARLLDAGQDVTFLVRPRRAVELAKTGLVIKSSFGNLTIPSPPVVDASGLSGPYDVVIVGCKAYDLESAMDSFAPAVGPETTIIPLLNGMRHFDALDERFGAGRVLGGICIISSVLDAGGAIRHRNDTHLLVIGDRSNPRSDRVAQIEAAAANANCQIRGTEHILQELWEKWIFIAACAALTTLMRATIGQTVAAGGIPITLRLLEECDSIAAQCGFQAREQSMDRYRGILVTPDSPISASMLKDVEAGAPTEAEHIIGDLLARSKTPVDPVSLLSVAYTALRAYEIRRTQKALV